MRVWSQYPLPYTGTMDDAPAGLLDQEFDAGYGSPQRPVWAAWTATHVGYATEYDGATGGDAVLRHPPTREGDRP